RWRSRSAGADYDATSRVIPQVPIAILSGLACRRSVGSDRHTVRTAGACKPIMSVGTASARHGAVDGALATGQLPLVVLAEAGKQGLKNCADLKRMEKGQRWLGKEPPRSPDHRVNPRNCGGPTGCGS